MSKIIENNNNKEGFSEQKANLSPMEWRVTQEKQTERPYSNKYNNHWDSGTYFCVVCDAPLFKSNTKFQSKSGWPAFYNVLDNKSIKLTADLSHVGANLLLLITKPDLARTEVSCSNCNAHLGHLFKDGPQPTGLRYCINSSSLKFKPDLSDEQMENTQEDQITNGSQTPLLKESNSGNFASENVEPPKITNCQSGKMCFFASAPISTSPSEKIDKIDPSKVKNNSIIVEKKNTKKADSGNNRFGGQKIESITTPPKKFILRETSL